MHFVLICTVLTIPVESDERRRISIQIKINKTYEDKPFIQY